MGTFRTIQLNFECALGWVRRQGAQEVAFGCSFRCSGPSIRGELGARGPGPVQVRRQLAVKADCASGVFTAIQFRTSSPNSYTLVILSNGPSAFSGPSDASGLRIGYLLSRYPAVSHTFFLKEVLGLRARGLVIDVASINLPDRSREMLPAVEAAESDQVYYVKTGIGTMLKKLVPIAFGSPSTVLRGLRAACKLGGWDLAAKAYALFYLAEALLVGDWMQKRGLPHLHVHFGGAVATVGMLTSQAWKIPWSVTLHGPDEFFDQELFYLRRKIETAAFVVCISDFCRSQVLRIVPGLMTDRLEVCRLGVDCDQLFPRMPELEASRSSEPGPRETAPEGRPLRLVCTGRLVSAKGHRVLLEAIAPLQAQGIELECLLIGDGPERQALEALCQCSGLDAQVKFLGAMAHQQALDYVASADVFVLASFAEGLPVALMEAMALGVPCISTPIAAISELIRDNQNGLLVPPANAVALRDAIVRLASDRELRQQLGANARRTVASQYNLANNLDRLANIWRERLAVSSQA